MRVYRIAKTRYIRDLSGVGARSMGGDGIKKEYTQHGVKLHFFLWQTSGIICGNHLDEKPTIYPLTRELYDSHRLYSGRNRSTPLRTLGIHPHPKVQRKMEALWLKSQGLPHKQITRLTGISPNTFRAYLRQYQTGGLSALKQLNYHPQETKRPPTESRWV